MEILGFNVYPLLKKTAINEHLKLLKMLNMDIYS